MKRLAQAGSEGALQAVLSDSWPGLVDLLRVAPPGITFYDTVFQLAMGLAASDHRGGRRRREAFTSPEFRKCFEQLRPLLPLSIVALVGGPWLAGPDYAGDDDFKCWVDDGKSIESLTICAAEEREAARRTVLEVANEYLADKPALDREDDPQKLFEYVAPDESGTRAMICDLASEGERPAIVVVVFATPLSQPQVLRVARGYFRVLLFVSTLLMRAERFREHNDALNNALLKLGRFRLGLPQTDPRSLESHVVAPARAFLKAASADGCALFELEELRFYLPIEHRRRYALCVGGRRTRPHVLADNEDLAARLMWHDENTRHEFEPRPWIFYHPGSTQHDTIINILNIPAGERAQSTGVPGAGKTAFALLVWSHNNNVVNGASVDDVLSLDKQEPGDEPSHIAKLRRGPTVVICTPPPRPPQSGHAEPPLAEPPPYETHGQFLMMALGRSLDEAWINIDGTSSTHASRVRRMQVFFTAAYNDFFSLLESRVREWSSAVQREIRSLVDTGRGGATLPDTLADALARRLSARSVAFYLPDATPRANEFVLFRHGQVAAEYTFRGPFREGSALAVSRADGGPAGTEFLFVPIFRRKRLVAVLRLEGLGTLLKADADGTYHPIEIPPHLVEVFKDISGPLGVALSEPLADKVARLRALYAPITAANRADADRHLLNLLVHVEGFSGQLHRTDIAWQYEVTAGTVTNRFRELDNHGFGLPWDNLR